MRYPSSFHTSSSFKSSQHSFSTTETNECIFILEPRELAYQVNQAITFPNDGKISKKEMFFKVAIIISLTICLTYLVTTLMVGLVVDPFLMPSPNTDKLFREFSKDTYKDIVENTIPYVQRWYQKLLDQSENGDIALLGTQQSILSHIDDGDDHENSSKDDGTSCLAIHFDEFIEFIPTTTPSYIRLVLQNLGEDLDNSAIVRKVLHDFLTEPQDLLPLYSHSQTCLSNNRPFMALACKSIELNAVLDFSDKETLVKVKYAVNFAAVTEALTIQMENNLELLLVLVQTMKYHQRFEQEKKFQSIYEGERLEFALAKLQGVAKSLELYAESIGSNINQSRKESLQINILEAVKLDVEKGFSSNARVGLALASSIQSDNFVLDNELVNKLGKEWVDSYISWNFVFVTYNLQKPYHAGKLIIPSVSCTNTEYDDGGIFLSRRIISLSINLAHMFDTSKKRQDFISAEESLILQSLFEDVKNDHDGLSSSTAATITTEALGRSNMENSILMTSSYNKKDTIFEMLHNLCGNFCHRNQWGITHMNPIALIKDDDYPIFIGFIGWMIVVYSGFGLEIFFSYVLVETRTCWSNTLEYLWWFAQGAFPLLGFTSLSLAASHNPIALPFLLLSCWKFGFPETTMALLTTMYDSSITSNRTPMILFWESIGTILHHSSASFIVCMIASGVIKPDADVFNPTIVLLLQHVFVFLRYIHRSTYIVVMLVLELFYELIVFTSFESYGYNHWTAQVGAILMTLAHWIWVFAAAQCLFHERSSLKQSKMLARRESMGLIDGNVD